MDYLPSFQMHRALLAVRSDAWLAGPVRKSVDRHSYALLPVRPDAAAVELYTLVSLAPSLLRASRVLLRGSSALG